MENTQVLIIGGGLAGLTAAIHLSRRNINVILVEKEEYPHHKVCGEYLSNEVLPYLNLLEIELNSLNPPQINRLEYSSSRGRKISCNLEMGGLGISRFTLDNFLFEKAVSSGCEVIFNTVTDVKFDHKSFRVHFSKGKDLTTDFVLGAYGKRSGLDKILNRSFIKSHSGWLAVKSHYLKNDYPEDLVSLHNFEGGYCGLSRTETGSVNACYLASYKSFKEFRNTAEYKEQVMMKNPELNAFFSNAEPVFDNEISIAQVSFEKKNIIQDHILMLGDAAGLIHPLCGNGMAMAIHSAKIAAENVIQFYENRHISRSYTEVNYLNNWNKEFRSRLKTGRILQKILLNKQLSSIAQGLIGTIPAMMPHIIRKTHGSPIYD